MVKQTVTYENVFGQMKTKDLFFNMSKVAMFRWDREVPGGLRKKYKKFAHMQTDGTLDKIESYSKLTQEDLDKMSEYEVDRIEDEAANLRNEMIVEIEEIVKRSYGIRGEDDEFVQSEEISNSFMNSMAYDAFLSLFIDGKLDLIEFIRNVMPISELPERA